ncbi:tripartite motif-containing protein 44 [Esox lucius]|uniref:B box-type domain-containing protein n=1 Tax=Esox lucius TaxID=8010 RepID=A0A3P8XFA9_ESOLU|nr:tripartite motif-containing protein 44 [Esox lucius]
MTDQNQFGSRSTELEEEELPQMDGSCDACEPDEAQPATQVCHSCSFAFCTAHAEKHTRSTRHPVVSYSQEGVQHPTKSQRPLRDGYTGEERAQGVGPGGGAGDRGPSNGGVGEDSGACGGKYDQVDGKVDDIHEKELAAPVTVERLRCKEHGQEGTLYCKADEKVICVVCAVQGEHRQHEILTLHEAYVWQKSREGYDLLGCTQDMADHIKTKWTNPEMSTEQLEAYVNSQFDELHRLVRLEEKRTLHLVDLKEAFLTAAAAEKIAEITVHTERLQEEMACITQQLGQLDQVEEQPGAGLAAVAQGGAPGQAKRDMEDRPRLPEPRRDPRDPRDHGESRSSMGHAP